MNDGSIAIDGTPKEVFKHRDELLEFGLALPQITEAMYKLREKGINVDTDIISIEEAVNSITRSVRV